MIYVCFIAEKKYKGSSPKSVKTTTLIPSVTGLCVFRRDIPRESHPCVALPASHGEVQSSQFRFLVQRYNNYLTCANFSDKKNAKYVV